MSAIQLSDSLQSSAVGALCLEALANSTTLNGSAPGKRGRSKPVLQLVGQPDQPAVVHEIPASTGATAGLFHRDDENVDSDEVAAFRQGVQEWLSSINRRPYKSFEELRPVFDRVYDAYQADRVDAEGVNEIYENNIRLVLQQAQHFAKRGFDLKDLVQEGSMGLMHALKKFVPSRGFAFSTYAVPWIKNYITKYTQDNGNIVRIPVHIITQFNEQWKLMHDAIRAGDADLHAQCSAKVEDLKKHYFGEAPGLLSQRTLTRSLSQPASIDANGNGLHWEDLLEDSSRSSDPEYSLELAQLKSMIRKAMDCVGTERERDIYLEIQGRSPHGKATKEFIEETSCARVFVRGRDRYILELMTGLGGGKILTSTAVGKLTHLTAEAVRLQRKEIMVGFQARLLDLAGGDFTNLPLEYLDEFLSELAED